MIKGKFEIENSMFIGVTLFFGIFCFLLLFSEFVATLYATTVIGATLFMMFLNWGKKKKGK